jgi:glucosyltransferase
MNKVLVYRSNLLPVSETFIKEQVLVLRRWCGILVGMRRIAGLSLDGL